MSKDPLRFESGDVPNLYAYANNDPVNFRDPNGKSATAAVLPIAGGAALADGPLPIGDVIGAALLVCAVGYDLIYEASKPWKCTASCNVDNLGIRVTGFGTGGTQDAACKAAKKDANGSVPAGSYKRHCQCGCWK